MYYVSMNFFFMHPSFSVIFFVHYVQIQTQFFSILHGTLLPFYFYDKISPFMLTVVHTSGRYSAAHVNRNFFLFSFPHAIV